MNSKIGLLYRVSSKPQEKDGSGLDVQQKLGKEISKKLGLEYKEFNEGVQSSFQIEINQRPKLVELLDEIQKPEGIRKVWVFNTDRLGRYSQSWYSILKVFIDYRVEIYIGEDTKPYDLSSSVDKLTMGVLSLISQYDNELRRMRSILGKRNSLKNGNTYIGGTIPFGYCVKDKKLVINGTESKYIKTIFNMYNKGKTPMEIKIFLDQIPDIEPRRSRVGWNVGTVMSMLKKEIYTGIQTWEWKEKLPNDEVKVIEQIKIKVPKIIDDKLWNEVQEKIKENYPNSIGDGHRNSLLKGLLVCPKCKLKLGHRFKSTNHYYGRCNEHNWRKNGNKIDSDNCPLNKSLRLEETDEKVFNTVIEILKKSSKIREQYKLKNLEPKFEKNESNRKKINTLKRQLRNKKSEYRKTDERIDEVEFDIRTGKLSSSRGKRLKSRFKLIMETLNEEIKQIENSISIISNSKGWINWLDKMYTELSKVSDYSIEKKKKFLNDIVKKIYVRYDSKNKSHKLDIHFNIPIIGDEIVYDGKINELGFKNYSITEGKYNYETEIGLITYKSTSKDKDRIKLSNRIIELREHEGLSFNEISKKLNEEKLYPLKGGEWYKSKTSSFYNYLKQTVPK